MNQASSVVADVRKAVRLIIRGAFSSIYAETTHQAARVIMARHLMDAIIEELNQFDIEDSRLDKLESLMDEVHRCASVGTHEYTALWCRDVLTSLELHPLGDVLFVRRGSTAHGPAVDVPPRSTDVGLS